MAKLVEVIETEIVRGKGIDTDPCRAVVQYWSKDGELLAERDPCRDGSWKPPGPRTDR